MRVNNELRRLRNGCSWGAFARLGIPNRQAHSVRINIVAPELKLASGMSNPRRMKDLVDVQELIEIFDLPRSFAEELDPFVRDKFTELWTIVHSNPT